METTQGKILLQQSRRTFCLNACQAASLIAVGAVLESCGGGVAEIRQEAVDRSRACRRWRHCRRREHTDRCSGLRAARGGRRRGVRDIVRRQRPRRAHGSGHVLRTELHLHTRELQRLGMVEPDVRVPVSRVGVCDRWHRRSRSCGAQPDEVRHQRRKQRAHDYCVAVRTEGADGRCGKKVRTECVSREGADQRCGRRCEGAQVRGRCVVVPKA